MSFFQTKKKSKTTGYNYPEIFKKFVTQIDLSSERSDNYLKIILNESHVKDGSLFLYHADLTQFSLKFWIGEKPLNVSIMDGHEFICFLKETQHVVFKDEVLKDAKYHDIRSAGIHYFTELSCAAVIPLFVKNQWVGLLNLGRSSLKRHFDEEDRTFFALLGFWLSHYISNHVLISEVSQQNKKLMEMTDLKNQLMANVTHELRTPLNGILGLTDHIIEGNDGPITEEQIRHLQMIQSGAESLLEIINNILSLIKVEATKSELEVKRLDLFRMVDEVSELFEGMFYSQNNTFHSYLNPDSVVYGDEDQVRTVFLNLIGNATKFTQHGQIEIHAQKSGEMMKICVKDTGIGISKENQKKIFDEFRQVDGSASREYGGAGLGLAIAKKIIDFHGGRLWVESIEGKGSEFYFTLPTKPADIQSMEY